MKARILVLLVMFVSLGASIVIGSIVVYARKKPMMKAQFLENLHTVNAVVELFPTSVAQLDGMVAQAFESAQRDIDLLLAIPDDERTFDNTAGAFDRITNFSNLSFMRDLTGIVYELHPDEAMRDASRQASTKVENFYVDHLYTNKQIFNAIKAYVEHNASAESLNAEQRYFLAETMSLFERAGLNLPDDQLEQVKTLSKEIGELRQQFSTNIASDNRTIEATAEELVGIDPAFVAGLKRTEQGNCVLGTDYPTRAAVYDHCEHADTRRRYYTLCCSIAYPANQEVLQQLLQKRNQLARVLGFASYAHYDTADQMVKTPERAYAFSQNLVEQASVKEREEIKQWLADLPPSVVVDKDGRIHAYDWNFLQTQYQEKHLNVNEQEIACYFPMDKTIQGLLDVYRRFLSVDFKQVPVSGLWHPEVTLIEVLDKDKQVMGYLFLDLYPRENKYKHAAHATIVPPLLSAGKRISPSVSILIANFPKATTERPALLTRNDVSTFFHEFGHALHAIYGATQMASFAGTACKTDFVEMPSQMLEEWLRDKEVLRMVSSHYQTGEPLPGDVIEKIVTLKTYNSGSWLSRQLFLGHISLDYHAKDGINLQEHWDMLFKKLRPHLIPIAEDHGFASFGHLGGYAAKYYGYLWSQAFACDMFEVIKQHGLFNPEIGQRYVQQVIGKGGSEDPNQLLRTFLGREPQSDAFLKAMGLR